jgi:Spy/CpxP family protein refolding chaperone
MTGARLLGALVLLAASAVGAAGPAAPPGDAPRGELAEKRMRTLRAVGVAEALDLETADALKVDALMRSFDDRRRPLARTMHESMKTLRGAANGDSVSPAQVDDAVNHLVEARAQMAQVDREMFAALAQGRTPQQKAKLALFLAHFGEEARGIQQSLHPGSGRRFDGNPPGDRAP